MKNTVILIFAFFFGIHAQAQNELTTKNLDFITGINMGITTDFFYSNFSAAVTNGVLLNKRYSLALGIGVEGNQLGRQLPLFFEGKYLILKNRKKTPFISITSGYLQPLDRNNFDKVKGGFSAGIQVGFQNYFSEHVGIATSVGYRYWKQEQESSYGYYYDSPITFNSGSYFYISNRFEVRLALLLK